MAVQIGARPDSGFDDPIGMLKDCHRRVEHFLDILCRVVSEAPGRALNSGEQSAIEAALRYFSESGPRHNMDEEESLFPRLRSLSAASVLPEVRRLESEHRHATTLHDQIADLYSRWIRESCLNPDETTRLHSITHNLRDLYRDHIQIEEEVVFPFAARLLDRNALATIGVEFKLRRT
jgi:hemerythrin-like domain-containing protein